jgi:hypothetical protein
MKRDSAMGLPSPSGVAADGSFENLVGAVACVTPWLAALVAAEAQITQRPGPSPG